MESALPRRYAPDGPYPEGVSWDAEISDATLLDLLDDALEKFSDRPAIDFLGYKLNYAQFGELIDRAALGLIESGIQPGDRVGLFMPNSPYYPIMFFAALRAEATVVNFSSAYKDHPAKLEAQIRDSGTQLMVTMDLKEFFESTKKLLDAGVLQNVVYCPMSGVLPFFKSVGFTLFQGKKVARISEYDFGIQSFDNLINLAWEDDKYDRDFSDTTPEQLAVIQYTSGTTGTAKGAMLSHFNMAANAQQIDEMFGWRPDRPDLPVLLKPGKEKFLGVLPFFHVYGLTIGIIEAVKAGAEMQILPDPRDVQAVLKAIDKGRPTILPAVPLMISGMIACPDLNKYNLSSVKAVISGGAAMPPNVRDAFEKATGHKIYEGYGLSETSPVVTSNPPSGPNKGVGLPLSQTEIRIIELGNPGCDVRAGEKGKIWVRGPQVMSGYWNHPEETAKVLTTDGWYDTGDIGRIDEDGYLHITGREKRMMSINGMKVSPEMIEKGIVEHPELAGMIAECCVVRVGIGTLKESGLAIIRFKPEARNVPTPEQLRDMLKDHLTRQQMPHEFRYTAEILPKNDTQKPDWKKLEELEAAKSNTAAPRSSPKPL